MNVDAVPGWYGKLPALGDFASRRLSPAWIACWDAWLADGLHRLREAAPATWLGNYLASPVWRFALLPGALPEAPGNDLRVGVLVPSVDRVGRYFPLVVVSAPLQRPCNGAAVAALWRWAGRIEEIAVTALHDDWTADALDAALKEALPPVPHPADAVLPPHLSMWLSQAVWNSLQGCSVWLNGDSPPCVEPGLPGPRAFAHLFEPSRSHHAQE